MDPNYPQLQILIKRDPNSYKEDFLQQYEQFLISLSILHTHPQTIDEHFISLLMFLSQAAQYYKKDLADFGVKIINLLENNSDNILPDLRKSLVQVLVTLQKQKMINTDLVLKALFRLLRLRDKILRELLVNSISKIIQKANKPKLNASLNKSLQKFVFEYFLENKDLQKKLKAGGQNISDSPEALAAHRTLLITIRLYKKHVWKDEHVVNIIAQVLLSRISYKILLTSLNFFLGKMDGKDTINDSDSEDSDNDPNKSDNDKQEHKSLSLSLKVSGKRKSTKNKLKRSLKRMEKSKNRGKEESATKTFPPLELVHDPHTWAEKLFSLLRNSNDPFETKLIMLDVLTRLIGIHKLILLEIYSFLLRYIQPHQKHVGQILAFAAQASHELIPPDVIQPLVQAIANAFISDHSMPEVIVAGLNGVREMVKRCPLAMTEELLHDLCLYKSKNHVRNGKNISAAARSLINLYRELNPSMLLKKDRGKKISIIMNQEKKKGQGYGQKSIPTDIYGMEKLTENDQSDQLKEKFNKVSNTDKNGNEIEIENSFIDKKQQKEKEEKDEWDEWEEENSNDTDSISEIDESDIENDSEECESSIHLTDQKTSLKNGNNHANNESSIKNNQNQIKNLIPLAQREILTDKDHLKIRKRLRKGGMNQNDKVSSASEHDQSDEDDEENGPDYMVRPSKIEALTKRFKQDYHDRMAQIASGRPDDSHRSHRWDKDRASKTNKDKSKKKNQIMMSHKKQIRNKRLMKKGSKKKTRKNCYKGKK